MTHKDLRQAELTVRQRLEATQKHAEVELQTYQQRARKSGWSVNAAIGAQILFGALTTGISAATTGRQSSIATSILGGLSTMAASYLAKARGSGEPEASRARSRELEHFGRDIEGFLLDHGNAVGSVFDDRIARFRRRFEEIMGNDRSDRIGDFTSASTEKKKHDSPV
ncbi:unnamed protein product [Somion occarium]|uniref:SMODS and SLOG-associating 2TM effector domain-containing protein n=1 Tax=Somion occarium TaxID=3059160 RepID=A0ABP1DJW7_9APHY